MARQVQLRRGTTAQVSGFTGAQGELIVDINTNVLYVHDGNTMGGHPVASKDYVDTAIAGFNPVGSNEYTKTEVDNRLALKVDTLSLAAVATSGSYSDLLGAPALSAVATSGSYIDLTGKPTLATVATSGSYIDLTGKPTLATVATTGSYTDLINAPTNLATQTFVTNAIESVVGAAPAALDTLAELATALQNDESALSALTTTVSSKASTTYVDSTFATQNYVDTTFLTQATFATESINFNNSINNGLALKVNSADIAQVGLTGDYNDLINRPYGILAGSPASSIGLAGDLPGEMYVDANWLYLCTAAYDGVTNIWVRMPWQNTPW